MSILHDSQALAHTLAAVQPAEPSRRKHVVTAVVAATAGEVFASLDFGLRAAAQTQADSGGAAGGSAGRRIWASVHGRRFGACRLGFWLEPRGNETLMTVQATWLATARGAWRLVGKVIGEAYAGWTARRILGRAVAQGMARGGGAMPLPSAAFARPRRPVDR